MTRVDDGTEPGHQAGRAGHRGRNETPGSNGGPVTGAEDGARDRRKFLTRGLTAGAAALGAWSLTSAPPARAATGDPVIAGEIAQAGSYTGLLMVADPYSIRSAAASR